MPRERAHHHHHNHHHHHHHHHHYQNDHAQNDHAQNDHQQNDHGQAVTQQYQGALIRCNLALAVFRDHLVAVEFDRLQPRSNAAERGSQTRHPSRPQLRPRPGIPAPTSFSGKMGRLNIIEKAVLYDVEQYPFNMYFVRNDKREGLQMDICWKVPSKYVWLARVSSIDMVTELHALFHDLSPPERSRISMMWCGELSPATAISLIVSPCQNDDGEKVENGEGEVIPGNSEQLVTLGRLLDFEVKKG
jgi:G3E family GTPase